LTKLVNILHLYIYTYLSAHSAFEWILSRSMVPCRRSSYYYYEASKVR